MSCYTEYLDLRTLVRYLHFIQVTITYHLLTYAISLKTTNKVIVHVADLPEAFDSQLLSLSVGQTEPDLKKMSAGSKQGMLSKVSSSAI